MNSESETGTTLPEKAIRVKKAGFPLKYLFKVLYNYSRGNRKRLLLAWMMLALAGIIDLIVHPLLITKILSIVQLEGVTQQNLPTLLWLSASTVLVIVVFWILHGPARVMESDNAFRARINYRHYMLTGLLGLRLDWHIENHSGDTIDKMAKGMSSVYEFGETSFEAIYAIVRLVGSFILVAIFFPQAIFIVFGMFLIACWVIFRFDKILMARYRQLNQAENKIAEAIHDVTTNIGTVIILRVEKLVFETIMRKSWDPHKLFTATNKVNEWKWGITNFICQVMVASVLGWFFITQVGTAKGAVLANMYLLYQYLEKISSLCQSLTGMFSFYVSRQSRLVDGEIISDNFGDENLVNHVLPHDWQELAIRGLNFSYGGSGGTLQLRDISLSLRRGEKVAFVGESGSGKTTLLKVMRDLHKPSSLELTVDGVRIDDGFAGIARAIALAPQSPEIFATTIIGNITIGADHSMDEVLRFCDMAAFTEVARTLPKGFDSSIKEKGVNLSGGQQQRLALARALLACVGKDIILLDEPTSSLDSLTERQVYTNILADFPDATIISSIHRLHLLGMFDRVVVFDKGQIVDSGTLAELLSRPGVFQDMWQLYNATFKETEEKLPTA